MRGRTDPIAQEAAQEAKAGTQLVERRRSSRIPAAYPVTVLSRKGRFLARGRTVNISEHGVFILTHGQGRFRPEQHILIELRIPATCQSSNRREVHRTVCYLARIIRLQRVGQQLGMGIEFLEKIR